jgi:hypothetical protein
VTCNSEGNIDRLLTSLFKNTDYPFFHLTVIDNHSTDKTLDKLELYQGEFKKLRILPLQDNIGWARACNLGACVSTADIVVFLNDDLEFKDSGWLGKIVECFESDDLVKVVGARLFNANGIEYARQSSDWVCGAVFAVDRHFWNDQHGFDENYFFMWDETDFCKRTVLAGAKVVQSAAEVIHYHDPDRWGKEFFREQFKKGQEYFENKFASEVKING